MTIEYSIIFTNDVTCQDSVTLNDGVTVVDNYITRVRGILVGKELESDIETTLDIHASATSPSQKSPNEFTSYDSLTEMPANLRAALISESEKPQHRYQIQNNIQALKSSPYGVYAQWEEVKQPIS